MRDITWCLRPLGHHSQFAMTLVTTNFQGRTFEASIETYLAKNKHLNNVLIEKYHSDKVRRAYEKVLKNLEKCYPQYVDELKGIAAGAKVPFFKVNKVFLEW